MLAQCQQDFFKLLQNRICSIPSKTPESIPFIKVLGKRIYPSPNVKYLGVRLDEHLNWKSHISETAKKLQRANGALSKLCHYIPLKSLVNIYHALFSSHIFIAF